jgi:transposase
MSEYPATAAERAMKVQEVILRAMAKRISEKHGYDGLFDRRRGKPSPKRVPLEQAEEVLRLYREKYFDLNVRHFHEKLREVHGISFSYTWVKQALQGAGLVKKGRKRGVHRKRRALAAVAGDAAALGREPAPVVPGPALVRPDRGCGRRHERDHARLVEEESTRTVMAALREVMERKGRFCALYSDRASEPLLRDAASGRAGRSRAADAGGTGAAGAGDPDDPGLLAAGTRAQRAALCPFLLALCRTLAGLAW